MASGLETSQPVQRLDQGLGLSSMDLSVLIGVLGTKARLFAQVDKGRLEGLH